ncbi:hypothetical protein [Portibacter lacus]|uniref:Uncharacterized protein n=1 Tax=Portibacter lacus TaxID=1099794 RepID=A0AA37SR13_9BACT|nr:hypothetical protein [Portibacter lacus]GLR18415.1 hypothetical protein GCM10007940_30310 [Portibacter lacus]
MNYTAIIILFALLPLWIISLYLFSRAAWSKLSNNYRSIDNFYGSNFGKFNARINDLNYSSRLYLQYNDEGIHLSVVKRYRPFHPPVFIPWNDIHEVNKTEEKVHIIVGNHLENTPIEISMTTFKKLEETLIQYTEKVNADL